MVVLTATKHSSVAKLSGTSVSGGRQSRTPFCRLLVNRRLTTRIRAHEEKSRSRHLSNLSKEGAVGLWPVVLWAREASAEGPAGAPDSPRGISVAEVILLLAPLLLYGGFSLYREKINPKAKLSDFLFVTAGVVIVLNVLSILLFKVRLY